MKMRSPTASARLHAQAERARQMRARVVAAQLQRLEVGLEQLLLALVLLADQRRRSPRASMSSSARQRADVDDVLEQLALARVGVGGVADLGQRHADDVMSSRNFDGGSGLVLVVEEVAARLDLGDVLVPGLRVHRHHQVDAAAPAAASRAR